MPSEALAKERWLHYVYLIEVAGPPREKYVGITTDVKRRFAD
jgi:predicted GIY-YIG superfamily endonuclease